MRDLKAYVRSKLALAALPPEHEQKIVDEIAAQLEEVFATALAGGRSADEAWKDVENEIPDWVDLQDQLADAAPLTRRLADPERAPFAGPTKRTIVARLRALACLGVVDDVRLGWRRLRKERGFAVTTLITLAVCLGANVAIFTLVYSVLLQPLPGIPDATRVVAFADQFPTADPSFSLLNNVRSYFDRPAAVPAVVDQAMLRKTRRAIDVDGLAEQAAGLEVTSSFFALVRTLPALGRPFNEADAEIGNEERIILSHGLWQRAYAADPAVVGKSIDLNGRPFTIVGVMPAGFSFFDSDVRFWLPLAFTPEQRVDNTTTRLTYGLYHMGRLAPGATLEQAQSQVDALNAANMERLPDTAVIWKNTRFHTVVISLHDALVRDVSGTLYLLWAAAAFVLLIGAINIANLTLARANMRARELATRLAIGASRLRLARFLTLESLVLAVGGGLLGLAVGTGILHSIQAQTDPMPGDAPVRIGWIVASFTVASAVLVGLLIGAGSSVGLRSLSLQRALGGDGRGGTGGRRAQALRRCLVVAQIALSVVLLVGAGLLLASFRNLLSVDPGFDGRGVITAALNVPATRYTDDAAVRELTQRLLASIRAIPGVDSAGLTNNVPLGTAGGWGPIIADDYDAKPGESVVSPWRIVISPGYLESIGTQLVRGRAFDERDGPDAERVMLIDESLARRFWGDADPVGTRMYRPTYPEDLNRTDENTQFFTVVGVLRDVQLRDLSGLGGRAFGSYYFPHTQSSERNYFVVIKTQGAADVVMGAVRRELARLDPQLPLFDVRTMSERTDISLASRKIALGLAASFGVVALLLAALGIYGVLAYLVAQRNREIGIRIALGSSPRAVFRLVLGEGVWLTVAGLLLGIAGALAVARSLGDQVFGVAPTDPVVLGGVVLVTGAIALLACVSPARRATRVDPIVALSDS
jgi:predicted permease